MTNQPPTQLTHAQVIALYKKGRIDDIERAERQGRLADVQAAAQAAAAARAAAYDEHDD